MLRRWVIMFWVAVGVFLALGAAWTVLPRVIKP